MSSWRPAALEAIWNSFVNTGRRICPHRSGVLPVHLLRLWAPVWKWPAMLEGFYPGLIISGITCWDFLTLRIGKALAGWLHLMPDQSG